MLSYYTKHSPNEDFQKTSSPPDGNTWVVAEDTRLEELSVLVDRFHLDLNIVRDVLDNNELPRVEFSDDCLYVFLRTPHTADLGEIVSLPLLVVVSDSAFLTISTAKLPKPSEVMTAGSVARTSDTEILLLSTLAATVSSYETYIQKTAKYIKDTGHRLRSHEANNKDFINFVTVEDNLNDFQMDLSSMLTVAQRLKDNMHGHLSEDDIEAIDDIALYIQQLLVSVSIHTKIVTSIRNAYSTVANNNLNQSMKTLTVLTVLIALPNVFYGMFGMNVPLPFSSEPWAYPAIVLFTILLIILVVALAKRFRLF